MALSCPAAWRAWPWPPDLGASLTSHFRALTRPSVWVPRFCCALCKAQELCVFCRPPDWAEPLQEVISGSHGACVPLFLCRCVASSQGRLCACWGAGGQLGGSCSHDAPGECGRTAEVSPRCLGPQKRPAGGPGPEAEACDARAAGSREEASYSWKEETSCFSILKTHWTHGKLCVPHTQLFLDPVEVNGSFGPSPRVCQRVAPKQGRFLPPSSLPSSLSFCQFVSPFPVLFHALTSVTVIICFCAHAPSGSTPGTASVCL